MTQAFNLSQLANGVNTSGQLNIASYATGTLPVANGGTGVATLTGIVYGNGTGAMTAATAAQVLAVVGTVPIANGGTNSTATPTNGGVGYGTGTAHAYTAAGTAGQVLTSNGAAAPTWQAASGGGNPAGTLIQFAGTTAPTGYLLCPTSATNVSRTTYAALFAAIGTTWGAGDGSTTFGIPYFPADYAMVQANANVSTSTVGQNLSHTHTTAPGYTWGPNSCGTAGISISTSIQTAGDQTGASGGAANLAAGRRVLFCVKY